MTSRPGGGDLHRVEAVSDGAGSYRWICSCGSRGDAVGDFSETDLGVSIHLRESEGQR